MPYQFPATPPRAALDYFKSKGIKPGFDYRDVWREEHGYAFTVAKLMQADLLRDVQDSLADALERGVSFSQWKKDIAPLLQQKGWWGVKEQVDPLTGKKRLVQLGSPRRLKTIYNVNMSTARSAGQWQRVEQSRATHPYLLYELGPSREHREEHVRWAGLLLPSDDPIWQTIFPTNGYGCKCRVRQVNQREYDRLKAGGKYATKAPQLKMREWVNKRTGEAMQVPEGIDPGFDINPGIARQAHIGNVVRQKLNSGYPDVAAAVAKELTAGPVFKQFLKQPQRSYPVAALDADIKQRLNVLQHAVMLSADTLKKQRKNHPELSDEEYTVLPDLINRGTIINQGQQRLAFFHHKGRLYKAVVKATKDGSELYLVSFYRANERELERDKRRGEVIREE